ncbi:hypothetical protein Tco_1016552 [Tanacetum coccineum]|uniref:Uncharacterized protein n=1 Tax=Tanacetum coccineum TaxID=301880 RepID=A0ABQ5FNZ6_9ASTR
MSEVNDIRLVNLPHPNGRWLLTGRQDAIMGIELINAYYVLTITGLVNEEFSKYVTLDKKLIQSSPFYFSDDDHSIDKVTIPSKVYNMEAAGPSVTEKPTNGSLCLEVDFEFDTVVNEECSKYVTLDKKLIQSSPFYFSDDDHSIDKVTIPSKITWKRFKVDSGIPSKVYNMEEAGSSLTENPTNGSLRLEVALENSDHDTMIAAPSVRDLNQLAMVSRIRQV